MLPDLRQLRLRHGVGAPTGADEERAPDPKKRRLPTPPSLAAVGEALSPLAPLPEEDDASSDKSLADLLKERHEDAYTCALVAQVEHLFPLGRAVNITEANYDAVFENVLRCAEPPDRFLFSAGGAPSTAIQCVRLGQESRLRLSEGGGDTPAFPALQALRERFASNPRNLGPERGCGAHNCYQDKVGIHGAADWQVALRGILLALDQRRCRWEGGSALPETVAVRAPKLSGAKDFFDWTYTTMHRFELGLTLRAALKGIGPPVYATFPVKVLAEANRTNVAERGYGYVTESGWLSLHSLMHDLDKAHPDGAELAEAKRNIARSITALMHRVASEAGFLLLDIKFANMVGRRVGATTQYETLMIDFDPALTVEANMHAEEDAAFDTSAECVFFINGLLFLNQLLRHYRFAVPIFRDLCAEVVDTWRRMEHKDGNLCSLLQKDRDRVQQRDLPDMKNLMYVAKEDFFKHVRYEFYRMLEEYGPADLLQRAQQHAPTGSGFLDRFVPLVSKRFNP